MIEWIKAHPYLSGGAVLSVVVLAYLMSGGSETGTTVVGGVSPDEVAAGVALQQIQAQSADRAAAMGGQIQLATLASDVQKQAQEIALTLGLAEINRQQQTDALAITNSSDVQKTLAGLTAATQQSGQRYDYLSDKAMTDYMSYAASEQTKQLQSYISGNVAIAKINKPKQGLFSKIFG